MLSSVDLVVPSLNTNPDGFVFLLQNDDDSTPVEMNNLIQSNQSSNLSSSNSTLLYLSYDSNNLQSLGDVVQSNDGFNNNNTSESFYPSQYQFNSTLDTVQTQSNLNNFGNYFSTDLIVVDECESKVDQDKAVDLCNSALCLQVQLNKVVLFFYYFLVFD